jgi:natural product precursor
VFKKSVKKLSLNKETVRGLSDVEMQRILGGRIARTEACSNQCPTNLGCPNTNLPRGF